MLRTDVNQPIVENLIKVGASDSFGNRKFPDGISYTGGLSSLGS